MVADGSDTALVDRFCSIEGMWCTRHIPFHGPRSCFLAYPGDRRRSQQMTELAHSLQKRGYDTTTWQQITGDNILFRKICDAVYGHDLLIAEITDLNPNVLVEVGYAMAVERDAALLVERNRTRPELKVLQVKDQCHYSTSEEIFPWLEQYFHARTYSPAPDRTIPLLDGIDSTLERSGTVYYLQAAVDDHA